MKKQFLLLATITLFAMNAHATKLRVNNTSNTTIAGILYNTLAAAYNAANAGDTIYIEPSPTDYTFSGDVTKKIIVIGTGYFLDENVGLTLSNVSSKISGAKVYGTGAGSLFAGIEFTDDVYADADNLVFTRNRFRTRLYFDEYSAIDNRSNIVFNRNYFGFPIQRNYNSGTFSNLIFSNNIFQYGLYLNNASGVFEGNVYTSGSPGAGYDGWSLSVSNFIIRNNIFAGGDVSVGSGNTFQNNICYSASTNYPSGSGNQYNVSMTGVTFVNSGTSDSKYKLKAGSPAIGAGIGGIDCGAFGGSTPYLLSGLPNIPVIYQLSVPANSNGNTLNVTLSTKSNP